jgi:hypothetical protein
MRGLERTFCTCKNWQLLSGYNKKVDMAWWTKSYALWTLKLFPIPRWQNLQVSLSGQVSPGGLSVQVSPWRAEPHFWVLTTTYWRGRLVDVSYYTDGYIVLGKVCSVDFTLFNVCRLWIFGPERSRWRKPDIKIRLFYLPKLNLLSPTPPQKTSHGEPNQRKSTFIPWVKKKKSTFIPRRLFGRCRRK